LQLFCKDKGAKEHISINIAKLEGKNCIFFIRVKIATSAIIRAKSVTLENFINFFPFFLYLISLTLSFSHCFFFLHTLTENPKIVESQHTQNCSESETVLPFHCQAIWRYAFHYLFIFNFFSPLYGALVSDWSCPTRIRHQHDTDTYHYIKLYNFLQFCFSSLYSSKLKEKRWLGNQTMNSHSFQQRRYVCMYGWMIIFSKVIHIVWDY